MQRKKPGDTPATIVNLLARINTLEEENKVLKQTLERCQPAPSCEGSDPPQAERLTEIARRLAKAEESRAILEALLDSIPEGITVLDMSGRPLYSSRYSERIGLFKNMKPMQSDPAGSDQLPTMPQIFAADGVTPLALEETPGFRTLFHGEVIENHEAVFHDENGQPVHLLTNAAPIYDAQGRITGSVMAARDITPMKRVEQERERLIEELELERQRAELLVVEAEQRAATLDAVIDAMTDALVIYDRQGMPVYANASAEAAYGFDPIGVPREEIINRLHIRDDQDRLLEVEGLPTSRAMKGEKVSGVRLSFTTASGKETIILVSASPFRVRGEFAGLVAVWYDITEQEKLLKEINTERDRFRQLADSMPQLVWTADPNGQVTYFNRRYQEYHGIQPKEGGMWTWGDLIHPDDAHPTGEAYQQALQAGKPLQVMHRMKMADGSYRWHLTRGVPVQDEQGKINCWYGTGTDIHDARLAEEQLRQRGERLSLLYDMAGELLSGADPKELLDRIHPRLIEMLSLDTYVQYILEPDTTYLALAAYSRRPKKQLPPRRVELGQSVSGSVALTRQQLLIQNVQENTSPITAIIRGRGLSCFACFPLVVSDRLIGTLAFGSKTITTLDPEAFDLLRAISNLVATAMGRAEDDAVLQTYAERLEHSNRDLQEFAFVASHDLQEPLRKIEMFGALLLDSKLSLTPKQADYLERMHSAASRMRALVDDLLALSRVDRPGQPFAQVSLEQAARDALIDLEVQIERSGGRVEISALPVIEGDPIQIRMLMQNLIGNGLKFRRPGVPPLVRVYVGKWTRSQVRIIVEDNGIGFPQSEAEHIFQPFQRLVGRNEYDGTGIGLAIARRIVERHSGSLEAESEPGRGSRFIITLPLH